MNDIFVERRNNPRSGFLLLPAFPIVSVKRVDAAKRCSRKQAGRACSVQNGSLVQFELQKLEQLLRATIEVFGRFKDLNGGLLKPWRHTIFPKSTRLFCPDVNRRGWGLTGFQEYV